jgi:hypothetical protein
MNPSSLIASLTACTVSGATVRVLLRTCDTVDIDTPALSATSAIFTNVHPPFRLGRSVSLAGMSFGSKRELADVLRRDDFRRPKDNLTFGANGKFSEAPGVKALAFFTGDFTLG